MSSSLFPSLPPSTPSFSSLQKRRATASQFDLNAANRVLHIPELVDVIASFLPPSAIAACARLSREMNTLFTPYIWSDLKITTQLQEMLFLRCGAGDATARHRQRIRSMSIGSERVLKLISQCFDAQPTNIRSLALRWQGPDYKYDNEDPRAISCVSDYCHEWDLTLIHLLGNCPFLETLDIDLTIINLPSIDTCLQGLKYLKKLRIRAFKGAEAHPATLARLIDGIPASVEDLTIDMRIIYDYRGLDAEPPFVPQGPCNTLKKLTIHASLLRLDLTVAQRIFYRCQNLKSLSVIGTFSSRREASRLSEMLLTHCPVVDDLNIYIQDYVVQDEDIAEIISSRPWGVGMPALTLAVPTAPGTLTPSTSPPHGQALPRQSMAWKSIEIKVPKFGPLSSAAIVSHAPTLERVILPITGLEVHDLHELLGSAPNLKTLVSLTKKGPKFNNTFLKPGTVGTVVDRPWVCSDTLEELQLSVRPGKCNRTGREAMMDRLGAFEELKVLHLHNGVARNGGFTDFSLAKGGLERLGRLKKLEVFELKHLRHNIGAEERAWMGQQWPKLKRVCLQCDWGHHDVAPAQRRRFF
ncbi:hypothetical protein BGZ70_008629 [Mortierella alpina]|uniref:F-box domain-containing protein n=1 Tax=Mortierella alpina TaxID=64518 RepID=A0A9P6J683_MORAP|nr:hypothetical protein BGZ70_008629 [Mortierella alpina]